MVEWLSAIKSYKQLSLPTAVFDQLWLLTAPAGIKSTDEGSQKHIILTDIITTTHICGYFLVPKFTLISLCDILQKKILICIFCDKNQGLYLHKKAHVSAPIWHAMEIVLWFLTHLPNSSWDSSHFMPNVTNAATKKKKKKIKRYFVLCLYL